MEQDVTYFFQRNVGYTVIVRRFRGDQDGIALDGSQPMIEVKSKDLKIFKDANKGAILSGLIKEVSEPAVNWETANALSDDDIEALLKNYLKLKSSLTTIDSLPILYKIRDAAAEKGLAKKSQSLITARIDELEPDEDEEIRDAIEARREVHV